jgi:subtilisin family serine protease
MPTAMDSLAGSPTERFISMLAAEKSKSNVAQQKVDSHLRTLVWPSRLRTPRSAFAPAASLAEREDGSLGVYVHVTSTSTDALAQLAASGLQIEIVNDALSTVQGRAFVGELAVLAALPLVDGIRPMDRGFTRVGTVTTEGDAAARSDAVRAAGYDGSGVPVGVISDGIDSFAAAIATGDLNGVTVPSDPRCHSGSGDEATALLEIVHDVAPGARLLFSEGASSSLAFIDSVRCLTAAGARVIVDDVGFLGEPFFEDGPVANAVREAVSAGVSYHTSAGNQGQQYYEDDYRPSAGSDFHDFLGGPVDNADDLLVAPNTSVICALQWDDPFNQSANDYDLYLLDASLNVVDSSTGLQAGDGTPLEIVAAFNPTVAPLLAKVAIRKFSGATRHLKMFCLGGISPQYSTSTGSIFGHPGIAETVAVAALDVRDPGLDTIEPFSSRGPSRIAFPAASTRPKPDVTGFDGVSISNAGGFPACPPACRFFGTSAAAPHSAAVAALLLSKNPFLTPADVRDAIKAGAVDIGAPGVDDVAGAGRLDALAAAARVPVPECFSAATCDDGAACTTDTCNRGGCLHTPVGCSDHNACNGVETCDPASGHCVPGAPLVCDDGDACSVDTCDPMAGCVFTRPAGVALATCRVAGLSARLAGAQPGDVARVVRRKLGKALSAVSARLRTALVSERSGNRARERKALGAAGRALRVFTRVLEAARLKGRLASNLGDELEVAGRGATDTIGAVTP